MRLGVKQQVNNQWVPLDLKQVVGQTVLEYMVAHPDVPMVAAIYDDDNPNPHTFLSNREHLVLAYKDKGKSYCVTELKTLLCDKVQAELILGEFNGATLYSIESIKENSK